MGAFLVIIGQWLAKLKPVTKGFIAIAIVALLAGGVIGWKLHKPPTIKTGVLQTAMTVTPHAVQSGPADSAHAYTESKPVYLPGKSYPVPGKAIHDTMHDSIPVYVSSAPESLQVHHIELFKRFQRGDSVHVDISSQLLPLTVPVDFRSEIDLHRAPDTTSSTFRVDTVQARRLGLDLKLIGGGAIAGAIAAKVISAFLHK